MPVRGQDADGNRPRRAPALEVVERRVVGVLHARVGDGDVRVPPERAPGFPVRVQQPVPTCRAHGRDIRFRLVERIAEDDEEPDVPPRLLKRQPDALLDRLGAYRRRIREDRDRAVDGVLLAVDAEGDLAGLERRGCVERQAGVCARTTENVVEGVPRHAARKALLDRDHGHPLRHEGRGIHPRASRVFVFADGERVADVEGLRPLNRLRVAHARQRHVFFNAPERGELAVLRAASRAVDARVVFLADRVDRLVARHVLELAIAVVDQEADVAVREDGRRIALRHRIRGRPRASQRGTRKQTTHHETETHSHSSSKHSLPHLLVIGNNMCGTTYHWHAGIPVQRVEPPRSRQA